MKRSCTYANKTFFQLAYLIETILSCNGTHFVLSCTLHTQPGSQCRGLLVFWIQGVFISIPFEMTIIITLMNNSHNTFFGHGWAWGKWVQSYFHFICSSLHNTKVIEMSWIPQRMMKTREKTIHFQRLCPLHYTVWWLISIFVFWPFVQADNSLSCN